MALLSIIHLTLLSSLTRPPAPGGKADKGKADGDITDVTTDDAQAETGRVAFDFMGASGGMKIRNVDDTLPSRWVMLQQDKLEELTASGAKVGGSNGAMNMAGKGSWTPLAKSTVVESGASTDFFSTTFSKTSSSGATFSLAAHVSRGVVNTFEAIPCSACTSGAGNCADPSGVCSAFSNPPAAGAPPGDGACDVNMTACTVPVVLPRDALKFSITVAGWTFQDPSNKLSYSIILKQKGGDPGGATDDSDFGPVAANDTVGSGNVSSLPKVSKVGKTTRIRNSDGTTLDMPGVGKLAGGSEDEQDIDVEISTVVSDSSLVINFIFPNIPEGRTLYYDPTVDTTSPEEPNPNGTGNGDDGTGNGDDGERSSTTSTMVGSPDGNSAASIVGPLWAATTAVTAVAVGLVTAAL